MLPAGPNDPRVAVAPVVDAMPDVVIDPIAPPPCAIPVIVGALPAEMAAVAVPVPPVPEPASFVSI